MTGDRDYGVGYVGGVFERVMNRTSNAAKLCTAGWSCRIE